jgi:hypothetical protein
MDAQARPVIYRLIIAARHTWGGQGMTTEDKPSILTTVDSVLAGRQLLDQPRAVLLLRLCQFCLLFAPDRAGHYYRLLQDVEGRVPSELQEELKALRATLEETLPASALGSTAELLSEVRTATDMGKWSVAEEKRCLVDIENRLRKRLLPFGKGPVWTALVEAWMSADRGYALQLLKNVSAGLQDNFVTRMNKASPLKPEEWTILANHIGKGRVERVALKALDDAGQSLRLPEPVLRQVARQIRSALTQSAARGDQTGIASAFLRHRRLLELHASTDMAGEIPGLLEELYRLITTAKELEPVWMTRFNLIGSVLELGMQLKPAGSDVMTHDFVARLVSKTPAYLVNFVWAQWLGLSAAAGQAAAAHRTLMEMTVQSPHAEAWFLVKLVTRGLGGEAMALAAMSPRAAALLPRLRRAWLCSHPETAGTVISPADMASDPVGEFLAQGSAEQRAAYLKSVTQGGTRSLPGPMWAGAGTEAEPEGLRGFWKRLTAHQATVQEAAYEYLARNPLYSSCSKDSKKEVQFSETLRVTGYSEYRYQDVDSALLAALVVWGDQEPQEVQSLLRAMWDAIRPDDPILVLDWLRDAILSRCVNVFAADASVLTQDYLAWVKRELVDKGRQRTASKQIMRLRYPGTAPMQFCLVAAATVSRLSPARRDQILVAGLERFDANPALVESAGQLYSSNKEPLMLATPLKLKPNLVAGWQMGIVKNGLVAILQALMAQAASQAQSNPPPAGEVSR